MVTYPVGTTEKFTFSGILPGFTAEMEFTVTENGLEMHCVITTTDDTTLKRFCDAPTGSKPKAFIIEGYPDCVGLPTTGTVQAQEIASLNNPSKFVLICLHLQGVSWQSAIL